MTKKVEYVLQHREEDWVAKFWQDHEKADIERLKKDKSTFEWQHKVAGDTDWKYRIIKRTITEEVIE